MLFWSQLAGAGGERYLKSYCFGTNISAPTEGFSFADYSRPRGLETFEPCSIENFSAYGHWFQQRNVPWVEPVDVTLVTRQTNGFSVTLANEERFTASHVVVAIGLAGFDHMPRVLTALSPDLVTHTSRIGSFAAYKGRNIAIVGAGQSALEAAALLHEAGARPKLLVREKKIVWHHRISIKRNIWRRLRSPISGLGSGPTAWALTHLPGAMHRMPVALRTRFVRDHLPAEGAWWLRGRVENRVPVHLGTTVVGASETAGRVSLRLHEKSTENEHSLVVDHVIAGTGYVIDVERLGFLQRELRGAIVRQERAPALNAGFETSVRGLHFIGPASSMSFGALFRFVVGTHYSAGAVSAGLASQFQGVS